MNANMTGFRWFSKVFALDESSLCIGRAESGAVGGCLKGRVVRGIAQKWPSFFSAFNYEYEKEHVLLYSGNLSPY